MVETETSDEDRLMLRLGGNGGTGPVEIVIWHGEEGDDMTTVVTEYPDDRVRDLDVTWELNRAGYELVKDDPKGFIPQDIDRPERLQKVIEMWEDEYAPGSEFDYCGITMVRAHTKHPAYYPKRVGEKGLINVRAIPAATMVEQEIHDTIEHFEGVGGEDN